MYIFITVKCLKQTVQWFDRFYRKRLRNSTLTLLWIHSCPYYCHNRVTLRLFNYFIQKKGRMNRQFRVNFVGVYMSLTPQRNEI